MWLISPFRFGRTCVFSLALIGQVASLQAQEATTPTPQSNAGRMSTENPLLIRSSLPLEAPRFDLITSVHFMPAFEAGIQQQLAEVQKIADQTEPATFENTLVAMDRAGEILRRVQAIFSNLCAANTNDELQKIETEIAPKLASHSDNIFLNSKLFSRVDSLWKQREQLGLSEEQHRLLKEQHEQFIRAGAKLDDKQKLEIRSINEQLSSLSTEFQNNLLAITKEQSILVEDVAELDGMSAAEIAASAQAAKDRGKEGKYLLAITNTTRQPILTSLKNRELRQRVWEASAFRGVGKNDGLDNRPLVLKLARFRAGRASILGYENHAAFTLENQMAEKPEAAFAMLKDLAPKVLVNAKAEAEKVQAMMRSEGAEFELQPWDWEFYAEKVRKKEYQFDESLIKPYFELDNVLKNGVFHTFNALYGIEFRERKDLPVYHPDVRTFDVFGTDGKQIGLFYADYFQRDSKRGGAWMDALVSQSRLLNQLPVIVNVMNIPRPAKGEPALLSLDLVTTMFHEMGHGVHGLFSAVEYPMLSGTSVPRDFVEFPSTFHEDWAIEPAILKNYAKHHQTGEVIPADLLDKAVRASKFNKGFDTMEYVSAALLDLAWHSLSKDQIPVDIEAFEQQTLASYGLDYKPIPPRYRTAYFAHVWSGGYSAGYYAYLWSEVLAADAFAFMQTRGGLTRANGQSFRDKILSRGGTREVMQQYIDFRGHEPGVDALLIRRGLNAAN